MDDKWDYSFYGLLWIKKVGLLQMNIEDELKIDKNKLLSSLDDAKKNYSNYINKITGLVRFRSPLLTESQLIFFPLVT